MTIIAITVINWVTTTYGLWWRLWWWRRRNGKQFVWLCYCDIAAARTSFAVRTAAAVWRAVGHRCGRCAHMHRRHNCRHRHRRLFVYCVILCGRRSVCLRNGCRWPGAAGIWIGLCGQNKFVQIDYLILGTHHKAIMLQYVHFAHGARTMLQQPRIDAALVEFMPAMEND